MSRRTWTTDRDSNESQQISGRREQIRTALEVTTGSTNRNDWLTAVNAALEDLRGNTANLNELSLATDALAKEDCDLGSGDLVFSLAGHIKLAQSQEESRMADSESEKALREKVATVRANISEDDMKRITKTAKSKGIDLEDIDGAIKDAIQHVATQGLGRASSVAGAVNNYITDHSRKYTDTQLG